MSTGHGAPHLAQHMPTGWTTCTTLLVQAAAACAQSVAHRSPQHNTTHQGPTHWLPSGAHIHVQCLRLSMHRRDAVSMHTATAIMWQASGQPPTIRDPAHFHMSHITKNQRQDSRHALWGPPRVGEPSAEEQKASTHTPKKSNRQRFKAAGLRTGGRTDMKGAGLTGCMGEPHSPSLPCFPCCWKLQQQCI